MSRLWHVMAVGSALLLFASPNILSAGDQDPVARVARAPGMLAARGDVAAPWRLLTQGDVLPDPCDLRTGTTGPCLVDLPRAALHLGPDTRLRLIAPESLAKLESGRMLLRTDPEGKWSITAKGLPVIFAGNSAAEVTVEPGGTVSIRVIEGSATVTPGDDKPVEVSADTVAAFDPAEKTLTSAPLEPPERERIETWTAPATPGQGLGQLLIKDSQSDTPRRLNVARYHVHVVLQPPVALVQIDQSFYNPYSRQEEGTFVFNLPQGASVSRFAMYVTPERMIEGELIERQRASRIYESIVRKRRDPAILEQIGDNLFRMRVFPIFAKDTKRILLDYTLPLEGHGGAYQFRLPLLSDLKPIWDFRLTGAIRGSTLLESVASRSHADLAVERTDAGAIAFAFNKQTYRPETDFSLSFTQQTGAKTSFRSYVAEPLPPRRDDRGRIVEDSRARQPATYFMASVEPQPAETPDDGPRGADVLILADTSSGMGQLAAVRKSVKMIVHNLRDVDRFRLVCVDVAARPLHDGWLVPGTAEAEAALARLQQEFPLGGTNLDVSFQEALKSFEAETPPRRRLVVYLGDGQDTLSRFGHKDLPGVLADHLEKANAALFGLVVQKDDRGGALLRSLGRSTGGLVFDLLGDPNGNGNLFRWLLAGVPSSENIVKLDIEGAAEEDLYYPTAWLPGQPLNIFGRTTATDRVQLSLTTTRDGKPVTIEREFAVESKPDDVFVGRLWAQRKLEQLQRPDQGDAAEDEQQRGRIVALSQEWSLLSPHTAFLVLETERDYVRWKIDRQQRRRYWKPPDALPRSPLPADWLALVTPGPKGESESERFARFMRFAREQLAAGNHSAAQRLLLKVRRSPPAAESPEYAELSRRALAGVQAESLLGRLGPHRRLLDPSARMAWSRFELGLSSLLAGSSSVSPAFLRRHPHATRLLQEVSVSTSGLSLKEFGEALSDYTGTNVVLDRKAFDDVGIDADAEVPMPGWGKMSLRNYARFVLRQWELILLEEPRRLLITTAEAAEERLTTEIYPVADLLLTDRVAEPGLLIDPYLDRELAAAARIRDRLKRPISMEFAEKPLGDVARELAKSLGATVLIDEKSLEDSRIGIDEPVTAFWRDVPAEDALRWILDQVELDYVIEHEALVICTPEASEERLAVRLHSGRGVLYEYSLSATARAIFGAPMRSGWGGGNMGGGFGGMMGGMGTFGGGGGMGGGFRSGGTGENASNAGISSGGDEVAPAEGPQTDVDDTTPEVETGGLQLEIEQTQQIEQPFEYDVDAVVDQVTSVVAPQTWEDVGGPGSIMFFAPTLDFVVATTDEIHDEIEALFDHLRRLPPIAGPKSGLRPARIHPQTADDLLNVNVDGMIDLITTSVHPSVWEDVGGPCSATMDLPRLALFVSATEDTHDAVSHLLAMFRRSRYASLRSDRPWQSAASAAGGPVIGSWWRADLRLATLPQPKANELAALNVRRVPAEGLWKWRHFAPDGPAEETIALRRSGRRLEIRLPDCLIRTEGDAAAIGYPGLTLVERGDWGEAIRQSADVWLPWMPHRTNEELARWFDVHIVDQGQQAEHADTVRLRLLPPGFSPQSNTYLEATFSKKDGLPQSWQSYLHGKLTGRLRFADPLDRDGRPGWRSVSLEDGAGKLLSRWELTESKPQAGKIPKPGGGFEDYVSLECRPEKRADKRPFDRALAAIRRTDWPVAVHQLELAEKTHPKHPLLLLLRAWCYGHGRDLGEEEKMVAALRQVAAGKATLLTRFIAEGNFPWLAAEARYEILSLSPPESRQAIDWDHLVRAAVDAERLDDALKHAGAALAAAARDDRQFERERIRVELLLRLDRADEAVDAARKWAGGNISADSLATMAQLLAEHGKRQAADELFARALAAKNLTPPQRCGLMWRRADVHEGLARWQILLQAAVLMPADSPPRSRSLATLREELNRPIHAEIAATLAAATKDPQVKARLLLRQAELTSDPVVAANLCWEIYQTDQLPDDQFRWACLVWNQARQGERVIRASQQWLRSGKRLRSSDRYVLADAYRATGRKQDARRAATSDPKPARSSVEQRPVRARGMGGFF